MRERVRMVNGTISIESKPMGGTTIHVRVPLESQQGSGGRLCSKEHNCQNKHPGVVNEFLR
jgi:hypothetical protein